MFHHSPSDYRVAASQAAKYARSKFEQIIQNGRDSAIAVLNQVQSQVPVDRIARESALRVKVKGDDGGFLLQVPSAEPLEIHPHALAQIASKAGPKAESGANKFSGYLDYLTQQGGWGHALAVRNLNDLFSFSDARHLLRSVNHDGKEELRGFLSDRYRRLDSRPLLDAFMGACTEIGLIPIEGYALDTKVRMRAVLPYIFEPIENEVMLFGLEWANSQFGDGGHAVRLFNDRIWCTNLATMNEVLRQIHLGKRLDDNFEYSLRTYELDNAANASALKDVVMGAMSAERVNRYLELFSEAAKETIQGQDINKLLKQKLSKAELEGVTDLFQGPDVQNLPSGSTTYRLSNALSFFAQREDVTPNRRLYLQDVAGQLLPDMTVAAPAAVEV